MTALPHFSKVVDERRLMYKEASWYTAIVGGGPCW
jgi:hypothetical protein